MKSDDSTTEGERSPSILQQCKTAVLVKPWLSKHSRKVEVVVRLLEVAGRKKFDVKRLEISSNLLRTANFLHLRSGVYSKEVFIRGQNLLQNLRNRRYRLVV